MMLSINTRIMSPRFANEIEILFYQGGGGFWSDNVNIKPSNKQCHRIWNEKLQKFTNSDTVVAKQLPKVSLQFSKL